MLVLMWGLILSIAILGGCLAPAATDVVPAAGETTAPAATGESIVIYSGRNENLVAPLIEQFTADTGIAVEVRYGGTAEMAATILEEGANSPADLFFAQDAGSLGALAMPRPIASICCCPPDRDPANWVLR
ncbi:MAG: solute-binding protein, partial [Caldilineaceae bacterium]|nr:solute-binding protein [Caldilineaceae bacterium]